MINNIVGSKKWLSVLIILAFGVAGASLPFVALSHSGNGNTVDIEVGCDGAWTGSLQWTLDGVYFGAPEDLVCPDSGGDSDFKLKVGLPYITTGSTGSQIVESTYGFHIRVMSDATTGVTGGLTLAECGFYGVFDPDNLNTVDSEYKCGYTGGNGDDLSIKVEIEQSDDDDAIAQNKDDDDDDSGDDEDSDHDEDSDDDDEDSDDGSGFRDD